jgi:MFS superfamily sulfate permease-like transporter
VSRPVFRSLRGYRRAWLRGDVVAGLTVWAVLVPEALAYATTRCRGRWWRCCSASG